MTTVTPAAGEISTECGETRTIVNIGEVSIVLTSLRVVDEIVNALYSCHHHMSQQAAQALDRAAARAVNAQSAQLSVAPVIPVQRITQDTPQDAA